METTEQLDTRMQVSLDAIGVPQKVVRAVPCAILLCLACGCADRTPLTASPEARRASSIPEKTPPPLPINLRDILNLSEIQIVESRPHGPGLRFWFFSKSMAYRSLYIEKYDGELLTKLHVSVSAHVEAKNGDDLKMIHDMLCQIRPEDEWIRTDWPESTADDFSLPASAVHDGMLLEITREEDRTVLSVTATGKSDN